MSHFDEPKMDKKYLKIVSKFSDYFTANSIFSYTMHYAAVCFDPNEVMLLQNYSTTEAAIPKYTTYWWPRQ